MAQRELRPRVDDPLLGPPATRAAHEDHARLVARADEGVQRPGRAMDEIPRLQATLLALDQQHALARQHEEILLRGLGVVEPARLARREHRKRVSELREYPVLVLEDAGGVVRAPQPGEVAHALD